METACIFYIKLEEGPRKRRKARTVFMMAYEEKPAVTPVYHLRSTLLFLPWILSILQTL